MYGFRKSGVQLAGAGLSCSFLKIQTSALILEEIREYLGEKTPNFFPCGAYQSCFAGKISIEAPLLEEIFPAMKNSWLRLCHSLTHFKPMVSLYTF